MRNQLLKSCFGEMVGTFFLTFVASGTMILQSYSNYSSVNLFAPGLSVMVMIYSLGEVSGAHINPMVTFGFALRRAFPWKNVPLYWVAQLVGSLIAAVCLFMLFGNRLHSGVPLPHAPLFTVFLLELIFSILLMIVILSTANESQLVGENSGMAVGFTIILADIFSHPITSVSLNPVRFLGPAIVSNSFSYAWVYLTAPFLGALCAVCVCRMTLGRLDSHEKKVAHGKKK